MKKEYDLKNMKRKENKVIPDAGKIAISLRVDGNDLADIKREAERKGLPYQTLINSVIHQYVTGQLVEKREERRYIATGG